MTMPDSSPTDSHVDYPVGPVTQAAARDASPLDAAILHAREAERDLQVVIDELAGRLDPVLSSSEPTAGPAEISVPYGPNRSEVVRAIESHAEALRIETRRVEALLDRLEV